nr:valine--tRNA ligase, mitochondrial 1-like [Tanacetum cinerariifolium]
QQTAPNIDHSQDFVRKDLSFDVTTKGILHFVWKWKDEFGVTILKQLWRLGASLDWSREDQNVHPLMLEHFQGMDLLDQMVTMDFLEKFSKDQLKVLQDCRNEQKKRLRNYNWRNARRFMQFWMYLVLEDKYEKKELLVESRVLIPETTFVGVESRVLIPETTFVDVESRVLILETTFVGVESRVLIPETTFVDVESRFLFFMNLHRNEKVKRDVKSQTKEMNEVEEEMVRLMKLHEEEIAKMKSKHVKEENEAKEKFDSKLDELTKRCSQ